MASAERYELGNADGVEDTVYTFYSGTDLVRRRAGHRPRLRVRLEAGLLPGRWPPYAFLMTDYIKGAYEYFSGEGNRDEVAVKALDDKTLRWNEATHRILPEPGVWFTYACREDMASTGEG
ncbi:MAG: hypothetical protein ACLSUM_00715 [Dysosmobacter welbionis]